MCEPFGGQCVCLPAVRGRTCDECSPGSFGFSSTGCICESTLSIPKLCLLVCITIPVLIHIACLCDPVGSVNDFCDELGICECLPNVAGRSCSTCEPNFWGLTEGSGCEPCSCNIIGNVNQPTPVCCCTMCVCVHTL